MKKFFSAAIAAILALLLISCAASNYKTYVKVSYLSEKIKSALPLSSGYAEHGADYLTYRFEDIDEHIDGYSIIYSKDTRYADLVAVFRARSEGDAREVCKICEDFIEDQRALFSGLAEQYMPSEKEKLDGAASRRFGRYVIVCVLAPSAREKAFSTVEAELAK